MIDVMKASQSLENEVARLRGDLLTVSRRLRHDVGAEIGGILASCDLMREMLAVRAPELEELAEPVARCAEKAQRLIDRSAALLRASVAAPETTEIVDLLPVVQNVCIRLEKERRRRGARFSHPDAWPQARGTAEWLGMVWQELLANALACGGEDAEISLGWESGPTTNRFWVEDSGPGLSDTRSGEPFPAFEELHQHHGQPGLGLPIVRRLVEIMDGSVAYERKDGRSRFCFELPRTDV